MTAITNRPLNILIVTTGRIITPRSGGELRTRHLAEALAGRGHRVDVVALVARNYPARRTEPTERLALREMHSLWLDLALMADRLRFLPVTELPCWLHHWSGLDHVIDRAHPYDVIQYEYPWFAYTFAATDHGARVVYDAHNIESEYWREQLTRYPFGGWFQRRLARHETQAIRTAGGVAACSTADRRWMIEQTGADGQKIAIVPNGYDAAQIRRPTTDERQRLRADLGFGPEDRMALFIGSDTPANREAARAITETIAPALRETRWRCLIVGKVGLALQSADLPANVTVMGPVDDVLPWLQAADAGLNPMRSGSGSNVKLAEYLAAGLPAITTPFGLRGYEDLTPWVEVRAIDEFATTVRWTQWPGAITEDVIGKYSWAAAARRLEELYRKS